MQEGLRYTENILSVTSTTKKTMPPTKSAQDSNNLILVNIRYSIFTIEENLCFSQNRMRRKIYKMFRLILKDFLQIKTCLF